MLSLLIWSAGEAPSLEIWPQMPWHRHAAHLGMLAICLMLALTIARPNPFSFSGAQNDKYDPSRPGITRWTRHPILIALALWAGVHLLPNGDLAHVVLFGVLGAFAISGGRLTDMRKRRLLGETQWQELDHARLAETRFHRPESLISLAARMVASVAVLVALLLAHPHVIGVSAP